MAKNPTATQAIIEAIQNGDPQNVESVLADVDNDKSVSEGFLEISGDDGLTPFLLAARNGEADIMWTLKKAGAQHQALDPRGVTAMHLAAGGAHLEVIKQLLEMGTITDWPPNNSNDSVLHLGAAFEDQAPSSTAALGCARLLTGFFAHHLDLSNKNGQTPLHVAAECRSPQWTMALLERDANINAIDSNGDTPIHLAAKVDSEPGRKCVAMLLEKGACLAISNHSGQRPFHIASNELLQKELEKRWKGIAQDL